MRSLALVCLVLSSVVQAQTPSPTISAARPVPGPVPVPEVSEGRTVHEGMVLCGLQWIKLSEFACHEGRIICPVLKTNLCGEACYDPREYHCKEGQLGLGSDGLNDKSSHTAHSSENTGNVHYKIAVPGPGAYGQLLHDLGKDGIHTKDIEKIRSALSQNGIELTSAQVAVLLRDPIGSQAGLRQFETTLMPAERKNFDRAMPQIKVILADAAKTKSTKGSSGLAIHSEHHAQGAANTSTTRTPELPNTPPPPPPASVPSFTPHTDNPTASTLQISTGATTGEVVPSSAASIGRSVWPLRVIVCYLLFVQH